MNSQAYIRFARYLPAAAATATASAFTNNNRGSSRDDRTTTLCDTPPRPSKPYDGMLTDPVSSTSDSFHNLFPRRQLWQPKVEYPLWDNDWDGRQPRSTGDPNEDRRRMRTIRKEGVTRHIILVRHGQYDETAKDDAERKLTPLGREQADLTGRRLRELIEATGEDGFTPINLKVLRVSDMARAKETADIIAKHLPNVHRSNPDPDLNEGRPSHNIPGGKASSGAIEKVDEQHPRIEAAFQRYFYRASTPGIVDDMVDEDDDYDGDDDVDAADKPKHEFEVIVCHANVIRYFLCRALQIPPEAWLRLCTFNCSLTYLTIRPTGSVSCRMLGDIGHLPYDKSTFSMHVGYNW